MRDDFFFVSPSPYDWSVDRDLTVRVDTLAARYALQELRKIQHPRHPQAHADAIAALEQAVGS